MKNRFENDFYPGELLVRRNDDGTRSPVLVLGVVDRFCIPKKIHYLVSDNTVMLTYLMWDGNKPPYEVVKFEGEPQLEDTVYERLEVY